MSSSPNTGSDPSSPPKKARLADKERSNNNPRESMTCLVTQVTACPVCLEVPRGKILTCLNLHNVCETCFFKAKNKSRIEGTPHLCPEGRCKYKEAKRNWSLEKLIELSGIGLPCAHDGCDVKVPKTELAGHEIECRFKRIKCPSGDKDCKVSRATVAAHYLEHHKDRFQKHHILTTLNHTWPKGQVPTSKDGLTWEPRLDKIADPRNPGEFIPVFTSLVIKNGNAFAYVTADLKDPKCQGLTVSITARKPPVSASHTGPLEDLDKDPSELMGLSIAFPSLKELVNVNQEGVSGLNIEYRLSIQETSFISGL